MWGVVKNDKREKQTKRFMVYCKGLIDDPYIAFDQRLNNERTNHQNCYYESPCASCMLHLRNSKCSSRVLNVCVFVVLLVFVVIAVLFVLFVYNNKMMPCQPDKNIFLICINLLKIRNSPHSAHNK